MADSGVLSLRGAGGVEHPLTSFRSTGYFREPISTERLVGMLKGPRAPQALSYGSGLMTGYGPTLGPPLEIGNLHLAAYLAAVSLGISRMVYVVGERIAHCSPRAAGHERLIEMLAAEQLGIALRFRDLLKTIPNAPEMIILSDTAVYSSPEYSLVELEFDRHKRCKNNEYIERQHRLFEAMYKMFGARVKVSWTHATTAKEVESDEPTPDEDGGRCEAYIDGFTRRVLPHFGFVYFDGSVPFDPRGHEGGPYGIRPIVDATGHVLTHTIGTRTEPRHGRLFLREGDDVELRLPDLTTPPSHLRGRKLRDWWAKMVRPYRALYRYVREFGVRIPGVFSSGGSAERDAERLELHLQRLETELDLVERLNVINGTRDREIRETRRTRYEQLRAEFGSQPRHQKEVLEDRTIVSRHLAIKQRELIIERAPSITKVLGVHAMGCFDNHERF